MPVIAWIILARCCVAAVLFGGAAIVAANDKSTWPVFLLFGLWVLPERDEGGHE